MCTTPSFEIANLNPGKGESDKRTFVAPIFSKLLFNEASSAIAEPANNDKANKAILVFFI